MDTSDCPSLFVPGPGAYNPGYQSTTKNSGSPQFTMKSRYNDVKFSNASNPGPGTYAASSIFNQNGAGSSLAGRVKQTKMSEVPGPGTYSPQLNASKRVPSLAGRTKIDFNKNDVPPPGAYDPQNYSSIGRHSRASTMAGRTEIKEQEKSPGFVYDPHPIKSNMGISMAGRTETCKIKNDQPGPGAYTLSSPSRAPAASLGSRTAIPSDKQTHDVGPGAYNDPTAAFKFTQKGSTGATLGSRTFVDKVSTNPGPGTYAAPTQFNNNNAGSTLAGRVKQQKISDVPGPGTYCPSPTRYSTAPALGGRTFKPGVQDWEIRKKADAPSPDTYNLNNRDKGRNISLASRSPIKVGNENPGPGSYSIKGDFDRQGVGASFAGRTEVGTGKDSVPGPGTYALGSTLKSGGISMASRPAKRGVVVSD
ncbi:SHIPPO 1-like protein [Spironucleus salmonicida]|uniref:SHIPPO 1-like protein n=1 Tax=Spironucleus salmonicida TaxID=348837 RepID=V6LTZ0_9EUKA|nr:SHIPPO 1-like protein [Spironucleus salmonicida]|eukprot:EST48075.1 SHIPPO 1-like protein [Spironucleus salmonicida]